MPNAYHEHVGTRVSFNATGATLAVKILAWTDYKTHSESLNSLHYNWKLHLHHWQSLGMPLLTHSANILDYSSCIGNGRTVARVVGKWQQHLLHASSFPSNS